MALEYKQGRLSNPLLNPSRCKAAVSVGESRWFNVRQCKRLPWQDGWCKQHHPDIEAQRHEESMERYRRRLVKEPTYELDKLREEHKVILHQRDELLKVCKLIMDKYPIFLTYAKGLRRILVDAIAFEEGD